jgi:hypothetical protein
MIEAPALQKYEEGLDTVLIFHSRGLVDIQHIEHVRRTGGR